MANQNSNSEADQYNERIKRMNAAEKGSELAEFVVDEIIQMAGEVNQTIIARKIERALREASFLPVEKVQPDKIIPMGIEQAKHWGHHTMMPYGKFLGAKVSDVELSYLDWLAEAGDPFKDDLRRYLASDRVKHERDTE